MASWLSAARGLRPRPKVESNPIKRFRKEQEKNWAAEKKITKLTQDWEYPKFIPRGEKKYTGRIDRSLNWLQDLMGTKPKSKKMVW